MTSPRTPRRGVARLRWRRDDGSAALETVILAPPLLLFVALAAIGMRVEVAGGSIEGAAHDAARAASIARDSREAYADAITTARRSLGAQGLNCADLDVAVDTSGFSAPPGRVGVVKVSIGCTVTFAGVTAPGLPGSRRINANFTSPVDPFRARS
ncbi:TadE/TadG family type IV pilus assembly protein [Krasilnikovia sp. MM14-A1259]|uniref:TadE/TadG family type IV pilus assembly protein n=1 Tax=Krasilnikovia sp. MM14-A1259 TaxID=3373539 RepID=UPI00380A0FCC